MQESVSPIDPLDNRLSEEAERLRKEARGTPPGVERDRFIRRARLAETASHMSRVAQLKGSSASDIGRTA
ncbi:hypothetical protein, partial [Bradyrhizobium sp. SRL28]|uniref:hypothetical protein n=1 Tax=Bradyrhizobium sp. SRL28 TaxID=2836178 RepID=UPI0027E20BE5